MQGLKQYRYVIWIGFSVMLCGNSIGQVVLNKHQIHDYWIKSNGPMQVGKDTVMRIISNVESNERINQLINELKESGIDSFGLFVMSYPGYITNDSCMRGYVPSKIFLFWISGGKAWVRKINNHCDYGVLEIDSLLFFDYYKKNRQEIAKQYIMPIIFGATINKSKKIVYSMEWIDHEPNYALYCQMGNGHKLLEFSQSDIENKQSLFYEDNIKSKAYNWFLITRKEVEKLFPGKW